jgi:hypothetical protein
LSTFFHSSLATVANLRRPAPPPPTTSCDAHLRRPSTPLLSSCFDDHLHHRRLQAWAPYSATSGGGLHLRFSHQT